jgi:phosphoglycerate transport regulatory protein PgtC
VDYQMTEPVRLILAARGLAGSVPITEKEAADPAIAGAFQEVKPGQKAAGRQAEFEARWDAAVVKGYADAKSFAERALTAR